MMPSPDTFPVPLIHINETNSTNNYLQSLCSEQKVEELTVVVADFQTSGRGQRGNSWESAPGKNLLFSTVIFPEFLEARRQFLISQIISLAIKEELDTYTTDISIKWPNDVVVSHKKICGILTEMGVQDGKIREVVIGVGLNVNLKEIQDELKDKATSLYLETGKTYDRNRLIGLVMEKFEINYEKFVETCDLSMMLDDYNMLLANKSQPVRVLDKISPYEGVALEIDKDGALLVRVQSGEIRKVCSGEVSVRGLYSYI